LEIQEPFSKRFLLVGPPRVTETYTRFACARQSFEIPKLFIFLLKLFYKKLSRVASSPSWSAGPLQSQDVSFFPKGFFLYKERRA